MKTLEEQRAYRRAYEQLPKRRAWKREYDKKRNQKPARVAYRQKHLRNWSLKALYGVDQDWYAATLEAQEGKCAICRSPGKISKGRKWALYVDHDHRIGKARALLCQRCNLGVGYLEEAEWVVLAQAYLTHHGR